MSTSANAEYGRIDKHPGFAHGSAPVHHFTGYLPHTGLDLLLPVVIGIILIVIGVLLYRHK